MLDCKVKYASIQPSWGVWNEFYSGYMPIINIIIHYRSSLKGSQWLIAGKQSSARVNFGTNFEIIILHGAEVNISTELRPEDTVNYSSI